MSLYRTLPEYLDLVEEREFRSTFTVSKKDIVVDGMEWVELMVKEAVKSLAVWCLEQGYIPNGEARSSVTDNYEDYTKEYTITMTGARLK